MANINRQWKKGIAIACTHGELVHLGAFKEVVRYCESEKPQIRVHLGDLIDTAAFRSGAAGTADESRPLLPDRNMALDVIRAFKPTHVTLGNHDHRLWIKAQSPSAIVAHCAGQLRDELMGELRKVRAEVKMYNVLEGWFRLGSMFFGHGYWFNEHALRDHAEFLGGPCVIGHLHTPLMTHGRTMLQSASYCAGYLGKFSEFAYAHQRRASARWSLGCILFEYTDTETVVTQCAGTRDTLILPS